MPFTGFPTYLWRHSDGRTCLSHVKGRNHIYGQMYFWTDNIAIFVIPFTLLLVMNSIIIHTLWKRSRLFQKENQGQSSGRWSNIKNKKIQKSKLLQCYFLSPLDTWFCVTPGYIMLFYTMFVDFTKSPKTYAEFTLVSSIGQKMFYTNFGINFYLYVISGQKFRKDLMSLYRNIFCHRKEDNQLGEMSASSPHTVVSTLSQNV